MDLKRLLKMNMAFVISFVLMGSVAMAGITVSGIPAVVNQGDIINVAFTADYQFICEYQLMVNGQPGVGDNYYNWFNMCYKPGLSDSIKINTTSYTPGMTHEVYVKVKRQGFLGSSLKKVWVESTRYNFYVNQVPTVNAGPDRTFTAGDSVSFTADVQDTADDSVKIYEWDFEGSGNWQVFNTKTVSYVYSNTGTYNARVRVTDQYGATSSIDTVKITINKNDSPSAFASASKTSAFIGEEIQFTGTATDSDGISSVIWYFGDGTFSTAYAPTKKFADAGTYNVIFKATDTKGKSTSKLITISISENGAPLISMVTPTMFQKFTQGNNMIITATVEDDSGLDSYKVKFNGETMFTSVLTGKTSSVNYGLVGSYMTVGEHTVEIEVVDKLGLKSTATIPISVAPPNQRPVPVIDTLGVTTAKTGQTVTFDAIGSTDDDVLGPDSFKWYFGDGTSTTGPTVNHVYNAPATYTTILYVTDSDGAVEYTTARIIVTANQAPVAKAGADVTITSGEIVTLDASASTDPDGEIVLYEWDTTGDGIADSNQKVITKAYTQTTVVKLWVTDNDGRTSTDYKVIYVQPAVQVNQPPTAQFVSECTGLTCTFTDLSSDSDGTVTAHQWTFGDSTTSTVQNPTHTYSTPGDYNVSLYVIDNEGAQSGIYSATLTVSEKQKTNQAPIANFTYTCDYLECSFTDLSTDEDGTVVAWVWNFENRTRSTVRLTVQNPVYTFAEVGEYNVSLFVMDNEGATNSIKKTVIVSEPVTENTQPTANFTFAKDGFTVTFTDLSTDADGTVVAWEWNFGDSTTSTVQNPVHTYSTAGTRTVRLTVTDNEGSTNFIEKTVTVTTESTTNQYPVALAGNHVEEAQTGEYIPFIGIGIDYDGTIVLYEWDFDYNASKGFEADWSSTSSGVTSHAYTRAGNYTAKLRVTDNEGAKSIATRLITVLGSEIDENDELSGRTTYDFTLFGIDILRTYKYDVDKDTTKVELKITNMMGGEQRNFLIRDRIPTSFAEDIDDFKLSPQYDIIYSRNPEVGWNITLNPYETFTITYTFDGYKSLNDTIEDFERPRVTEFFAETETEEATEEEQTSGLSFGGFTGYVFGAFGEPTYGLLFLVIIVIVLGVVWKKEFIRAKWKSWTE